jgi:hypothetical protein
MFGKGSVGDRRHCEQISGADVACLHKKLKVIARHNNAQA